ncbi:MAG: GHMP kinase [Victivallales bacterium]|jgi:D-glycero-alpha-D-manno-heptose-7-phosphate kinase|nr:GHMP kinase [Victivallales bacterium]MBT7299378.1 GHMP kinase [Victivallales bacterium]
MSETLCIVNATAPVRVCDIGGWTDTWFAEHGDVVNLAVSPYVRVQIFARKRSEDLSQITVFAENYNDRFQVLGDEQASGGKHDLLAAAFRVMRVPENLAIEVHLYSDMPGGASTGTSAAVSVALIGALDALTPGRLAPYEVARLAQRIETEILGLQCGIQDQLCAAYGGVNYIRMTQYPEASVSPLALPPEFAWELQRRLVLVYLGSAHVSSLVHEAVIRDFEDSGPDDERLCGLRAAAVRAKNALLLADMAEFAAAMRENTEWQARMHSGILGPAAQSVIDTAKACGAIGWKLNGAGGDGGTVTLLFGPVDHDKRRFADDLGAALPEARAIPVQISPVGLRVWTHQGTAADEG